jgi:hypothetical protein
MARGDFTTLKIDDMEKEMLESAFNAISSVEGGWEFLKDYSPPENEGFMFVRSRPSMLEAIEVALVNAYGGHSGSSYGWTMRNMEAIAKKGWDSWASKWEKKEPDEKTLLQTRIAQLEAENARLNALLATPKEKTRDEKLRDALVKGCSAGGYPCAGCLARKGVLVEEWHAEQKEDKMSSLVNKAEAVDTFLASAPPTDNLTAFANAIQQDAGMRAQIPDIDNQADALRRFAEGKMSYAEMRSLCG